MSNQETSPSKVLIAQLAEHGITEDNGFYVEAFNDGVVFGNPEFFAEIARIQKEA